MMMDFTRYLIAGKVGKLSFLHKNKGGFELGG